MLVTQFNLYSGGVFTVAARTCDVTAAGFGAATLWAAVVPWWDENVSQSIYPLVGCAAGTGVVVYAQTKSPSFSAQDARVLWIDKNLTLGTNLVVPFKGDFNDSRMWPREGGGYALIAYHGATSLYHGLTFTGTGTDIALGQIEPFAIEGFQWLMTGPCRLLSGNLYASFEPYGTYTNFLPITYSTPIVEGAFFEVPEMNKSYTYSEALDDRRSLVVWARNWNSTTARYENFLALLQVEAVASGMVKGARAAFVRPY